MEKRRKQFGFTLTELLVVVAIAGLLTALTVPSVQNFFGTMASKGTSQAVINAAMSNARALAASKQNYVGLRFQQDPNGIQYMIFVEHDPKISPDVQGNLGCRAVVGRKPIELPRDVVTLETSGASPVDEQDATTFTVLFSPTGKVVIHEHWVRNFNDLRSGYSSSPYQDQVFNSSAIVDAGNAKFYQDTDIEFSRKTFFLTNKDKLQGYADLTDFYNNNSPGSTNTEVEYISLNPYTGRMVDNER